MFQREKVQKKKKQLDTFCEWSDDPRTVDDVKNYIPTPPKIHIRTTHGDINIISPGRDVVRSGLSYVARGSPAVVPGGPRRSAHFSPLVVPVFPGDAGNFNLSPGTENSNNK